MSRLIRRSKGAQPGNHNALKHGFYSKSRVVGRADRVPPKAARTEIDHDIALARATLKDLLARDPHNVKLITYSLSLLNRLIRSRQLLIDRESHTKCGPSPASISKRIALKSP